MGYEHEYLTAILQRARVPMPPHDHVIHWDDSPRRWKFYPDADLFPLPAAQDDPALLQDAFPAPGTQPDGRFDLALLSGMLRESYAPVSRRLGPHPNVDVDALPGYRTARWARGCASGGGIYPVSIYWVSGPGGPLTPGVYYYSVPHHAMQRLLAGDVSGEIRAALGHASLADDIDQFLVLGIKFWQNAFKYASFCYHATTMDIGTALGAWRMWAGARGREIQPSFWFDEPRIARLLGLDADSEGVFAVVPLRWRGAQPSGTGRRAAAGVRVEYTESERSRRTSTFEAVQKVHAAACAQAGQRPDPQALLAAQVLPPRPGRQVPLDQPEPLALTVRQALRARRSSFGRFSAAEPMRQGQLSAIMSAALAAANVPCDVAPDGVRLAKIYAFVNHVAGIEPGVYEFDPARDVLIERGRGARGSFLQANYFLSNYNLEQTGAVLVPAIRATALLDAAGARGYCLMNSVIGALAQAAYTASAAVGVGCGAALGFDNVAYTDELGLAECGEAPLLLLMAGHERPGTASFRYELA